MMFSTDLCPICNSKLEMEVVELWSKDLVMKYACHNKEVVRDMHDMHAIARSHYILLFSGRCEISTIVLPPYQIESDRRVKRTVVYEVSAHKPKKLIFESPLLDWDYSKPYTINRIKTLVTFS